MGKLFLVSVFILLGQSAMAELRGGSSVTQEDQRLEQWSKQWFARTNNAKPSLRKYLEKNPVKFIKIRAGTFQMGSPYYEEGRYGDEGRVRSVTLTKDFEIQQTEVTQGHWFSVMRYNPSRYTKKIDCPDDYLVLESYSTEMCPNLPVETVSWERVQNYIKKLNERNDGYTYRLPTEAEWEYAARGGTQTAYFFGNDSKDLGDYAWYYENSGSRSMSTNPVGTKKANQYGLYDMYGNVDEWTQDFYGDYPYPSVSQRDPVGAASGYVRSIRGGNMNNSARNLRSASRTFAPPDFRDGVNGFRLVRTAK